LTGARSRRIASPTPQKPIEHRPRRAAASSSESEPAFALPYTSVCVVSFKEEQSLPKKYVFANDAEGLSDLVFEEDISRLPQFGPGYFGMDLWINRQTPADMSDPEDPVCGKAMIHEPPDGGAIFRVLDFAPTEELSAEDVAAVHEGLQSVHVPRDIEALKDPSMHKTDTLNYFCLVSGELWALSEKADVLMKPGDVIVQKGCMHGWRNEGPDNARLVCVLIDALPAD